MNARVWVIWFGLALGCTSPAGATAGADATGASGASTDGSDEGGSPACNGPVGEGICDALSICEAFDCGGKTAAYNHDGCPRTSCTSDAGCEADWRCYALALGSPCISSSTECSVQDGTCRCSTTDDCNGIFDANCLPLSVYPPAQDCEAAAAPCDQLLGWSEGLRNAYIHHSGQGHGDLLPELGDCASRTAVARLECGEPACALLCELGDCDRHAEQTECIETCNAGDYTPAELAEVVDALARDPDSACACETCTATGSPVCAGLWGCE